MNMEKIRLAAAIGTISLLCAVASLASANPVSSEVAPNLAANGGFEDSANNFAWTPGGNLDILAIVSISGGDPAALINHGDMALQTHNVVSGGLAYITQDIVTTNNTHYNIHLSFRTDGGSSPINELRVDWDGANVYSLSNSGTNSYQDILIDPIANGSSTTLTISFASDNFLYLDDISVLEVRAAAPEPISVALLGLGLASLGFVRGRQRT